MKAVGDGTLVLLPLSDDQGWRKRLSKRRKNNGSNFYEVNLLLGRRTASAIRPCSLEPENGYLHPHRGAMVSASLTSQKTVKKLEKHTSSYAIWQLPQVHPCLSAPRSWEDAIKEEAERCGQFYVNARWLGGMLTNFKTMRTRIARLNQLQKMQADDAPSICSRRRKSSSSSRSLNRSTSAALKEWKGCRRSVRADSRKEKNAMQKHALGIPLQSLIPTAIRTRSTTLSRATTTLSALSS